MRGRNHQRARPPRHYFGTLMEWLWKGYVTWALFSLYSFNMLYVLAVPPFFPIVARQYTPFIDFMAPPFALALLITATCHGMWRRPLAACGLRAALPFLFNVLMIATLLVCAEGYRIALMDRDLATRHPACVRTESFWSSVQAGWEEFQFHTHGVMMEDGVTYLWSYRTRRFEAQPGLQGFGCMP